MAADLLMVPGQRARAENAELSYLLINPPLTDPTYPYHSISYLVGSCAQDGFTGYHCLDANIDALNYLARPREVAGLLDEAATVRADAESGTALSRSDELRYQAALSGLGMAPDFMQRAIEVFRSPESFYDYPVYRDAAMAVHRFMNLLSLRSLPGLLNGFALRMNGPVNFLSRQDLGSPAVIDAIAAPFDSYVKGPFRELLSRRQWRLVGLSVNYISQLPFALRMAREIRETCSGAVIVFGGTEVCDDVKYARDPASLWDIFAAVDLLVPGEGESPLVDILCAVRDRTGFDQLAGVLTRGADTRGMRLNYEHVGRLPAPRYDMWDWPAYWSPEPVVLYSPTRGCYWNKCTFCDYGLNTDRPTAPSRERPVETVLADLRQIASFSRTAYFSVDAMSPRYLRQLATSMADADLGLRWSAELRLERTFPRRGIADLLRRAGCVSVAFGYESGTQRILDLINKGVDIAAVPGILRHLADAGIGVQMMGFTGFPSETPLEASETYDFLIRHKALWTLAGVGGFSLTAGSIVARQPHRFGVEVLPLPSSHDIGRLLGWRELATGREHQPGADADSVDPALRAQIRRGLVGRPFVGGVDAAHTLLYFGRNGRTLLPVGDTASASGGGRPAIAAEQLASVPFASLDEFCSVADLEAAHLDSIQRYGRVGHGEMSAWLAGPGAASPGMSHVLVTPGGSVASLGDVTRLADDSKILCSLRALLNPTALA
jgi:anaerobic magnesium-protoporphyrin IX monomethyl ester cyclase